MKTQAAAIVSALWVLVSFVSFAEAQGHRITKQHDGVNFKVDWYEDGRTTPYKVVFKKGGITSSYRFNSDGRVEKFWVDGERYDVNYWTNGDLKKVVRKTSRRTLAADGNDSEVVEAVGGMTALDRRRLHECYYCEMMWELLHDVGVPSVCAVNDIDDPLLPEAQDSIDTLCFSLGNMLYYYSPYSLCYGECEEECLPPLSIVLEWFNPGDLDLYVVEPHSDGSRLYWMNMYGAFGYLDQDNVSGPWNGPEQYTMYSYLSGDSHLGQYWVFASKYGGSDVSWRLTAVDGYGDVLLQEEGEFVDGCGGQTLSVFNFYLARYLDNGCDVADMAAVSVVENRSPKAETGNA